jgi:hypothetical protein
MDDRSDELLVIGETERPQLQTDASTCSTCEKPYDARLDQLLDALPDDPFAAPPADVIRVLLERRAEAECAVVVRLMRGTEGQRVPVRGYRNVYLLSLVGEWRSQAAVPALLRHLGTPWGYGWDEVVHAATRIGSPALTPLLYASFDRTRNTLQRRRAMRAMAGIAAAAAEHADDPAWIGDGRAQWREATAALRLLLRRRDSEPVEVLDEAAARLCDLRCVEAWEEIVALFRIGVLRERDGFTIPVANDLMHGRLVPFELGTWRASMTDWMLRSPR